MKKILFYTENYLPGGSIRYLIDLINNTPRNYEVIVISNNGGLSQYDFDHMKREITYQTVKTYSFQALDKIFEKYHSIFFNSYLFLKYVFSIVLLLYFRYKNKKQQTKTIGLYKPDLVFSCNGGFPGALSCLDIVYTANKTFEIPVFLLVVSMPRKKSLFYNSILFFYKDIHKFVDKLIVNSKSIKNEFINIYMFDCNKVSVLYNCVEVSNSTSALEDKNDGRNITIGYVGRIEESKGSFYLINAFKDIVREFENVKLVLVGYIDDKKKLNDLLRELNLTDKVILKGFYNGNIRNVLDEFKIFVFPSLWEGFPYSILEAMEAGKIIISTNVGGIPEAIVDGYNGLLINPSDSVDLADKLRMVLSNIEFYNILGENAKKTVCDRFSQPVFNKELEELLPSFKV